MRVRSTGLFRKKRCSRKVTDFIYCCTDVYTGVLVLSHLLIYFITEAGFPQTRASVSDESEIYIRISSNWRRQKRQI